MLSGTRGHLPDQKWMKLQDEKLDAAYELRVLLADTMSGSIDCILKYNILKYYGKCRHILTT
jgi:hypothetical protein